MALRVELWTDAGLVGGVEQWWDDVDAWMNGNGGVLRHRYPIVGSFDPYGFATIPGSNIPALRAELSEIAASAPAPVAGIAKQLAALCAIGLRVATAELRLMGD